MRFASITHTVNLNDHSGQSFCSPVNVGALPSCEYPPVVLLLAQLRSEVSYLAELVLSVSGLPSVPLRLLASAMADVSGILLHDGQCLSLWVRDQRLRYHVGRCTSCSLLTTVPSSSSHNSRVPHRKQVTQEKSPVRCNDVFRLNK